MYTGDEDYKVTSSYGEDEMQMNKGGAVDGQMQMAFMNEGGIMDDGMDVDPVSGNEVPPGSLAEEVRDDIPAQLSEGEYVVPADVVRYYGVKFFEDLRDQAKMGLAEMEANGRIGGEPVPAGGPVNDQELSPQEMQAIQEMMGMAEGGEVQNPYLQQQQLYSQPRPAPIDEKRNTTLTNINPNPVQNQMPMQSMASGGQVQGYQSGNPVTEVPTYAQNTFNPFQYGMGYSFTPSPIANTGTPVPVDPNLSPTAPTTAPVSETITAFEPVKLKSPEGNIITVFTQAELDKHLALDYVRVDDAATTDTTIRKSNYDSMTPAEKAAASGAIASTSTSGFDFKEWGKGTDWKDPDAIKNFVDLSTKGGIDPKTGKTLAKVGMGVAGVKGALVGAAVGTGSTLSTLSDLRAAQLIAEAQGFDTKYIDDKIDKIREESSSLTRFLDNVFRAGIDGEQKSKIILEELERESKEVKPTFVKPDPKTSTTTDDDKTYVKVDKDDRTISKTSPTAPGAKPSVTPKGDLDIAEEQESSVNVGGPGFRNKGGLMKKKGKKKK